MCLSATPQDGFSFETGMGVGMSVYESVFADTYRDNASVFIPGEADEQVWVNKTRGTSMDMGAHAEWCAPKIAQLVVANHGAALVLSATVAAGKLYADTLRQMTGLRVLSQWDDRPVQSTIAQWRADPDSVLVGTRTLMTGVDAPGDTCTLVVVDRVPRAAGNPGQSQFGGSVAPFRFFNFL